MKRNSTFVETKLASKYADTENREVRVKCYCRLQLEKLPIEKEFVQKVIRDNFPKVNENGTFYTYGKAKCLAEDDFDGVTGLHLAETRAQEKAYFVASRVFWYVEQELESRVAEVCNVVFNCDNAVDHCIKHEMELGDFDIPFEEIDIEDFTDEIVSDEEIPVMLDGMPKNSVFPSF